MADRLTAICADLAAEHAALDERVAGIDDRVWEAPTPADGWAVRDQVSHLHYFDGTAVLAMTDPDAFTTHVAELVANFGAKPDVERGRSVAPATLLAEWREGRAALLDAVAQADPTTRVPWYGPPMSLTSFVTARLMETWAHGQDVADALHLPPVVSDRLRHVCHIGVSARPYAFRVNGVEDTGTPVRVEASTDTGEIWGWGPEDALDRIEGPAIDLALVFTQRRHPDDTSVKASGATAAQWLSIAQAFAGPAGPGRAPGMPSY